ncbi:hypothetical protein Tco_1422164 [Tanacetum coccineum]
MTDYSLWEVILNGNKVLRRTIGKVEQEYEPTSAEEKHDRRNEMKGRGTLLMALPNKDQLKFHSYKDTKLLTEAIEKRNKEEIETISLDDLYNNLKIYEPELTGSSNTSKNLQNVAFVSSNITNSNNNTNEANNTTYGVSNAHTQSNTTSGDNLKEMDLQWEMVILTIRARRFIKRTCRKFDVNGQRVRFDSYQDEEEHPTNYALMAYTSSGSSSNSDSEITKKYQFNLVSYKAGLESVEARLTHYKKNEVVFEESINVLNLEVKLRDNALVENKKNLEKQKKERDELKLTLEKFQNSSKSLNNLLESQVCDKFKTGLGYNAASPIVESFVNSSVILEYQENNKSKSNKRYHAVPPPYTGNFIPSKPDLMFMDEIVESENMNVVTVVTPSNVKKFKSNYESTYVKNNDDAVEPKIVRKNSFRPPVIEDWNSDDDNEVEFIPNVEDKTVRPSTEKIKFVKSARETVEKVETPQQNKQCGKINTAGASVNTAVRPDNTVGSKTNVNHPRPISNAYKKGYSQVTRKFNKYSVNKNSIFNKKVNTIRVKDTNARNRAVVSENK